jgi:hypothetical protein
MLVSGLLIYYLYLKPIPFTTEHINAEPFLVPTTTAGPTIPPNCPQATVPTLPTSILSRYFGIGFNIYPASNNKQLGISNRDNVNIFLIEHIPIIYNGTL